MIRCKNWCSISIYFIFPWDSVFRFYLVTLKHNFLLKFFFTQITYALILDFNSNLIQFFFFNFSDTL